MQVIKLYKYNRTGGGVTVSPIKPDCEYTELVRLVADEGKVLTNDGDIITSCIDTETVDGWHEIDEPIEDDKYQEGEEVKQWQF